MKYDDMREEAEERYRKKQGEMKFNKEQRKILRFNVSELKPELRRKQVTSTIRPRSTYEDLEEGDIVEIWWKKEYPIGMATDKREKDDHLQGSGEPRDRGDGRIRQP